MKKNKTLINELREELRYHQMMVRVDLRTARLGMEKCREIGAAMRALQNPPKPPELRLADWTPEPFDEKAFSQKGLFDEETENHE
jgi:hypothetical protein